jgi:hypothetical protein
VVADVDDVAPRLLERYKGVADRVGFYVPLGGGPDARKQIISELQAA